MLAPTGESAVGRFKVPSGVTAAAPEGAGVTTDTSVAFIFESGVIAFLRFGREMITWKQVRD